MKNLIICIIILLLYSADSQAMPKDSTPTKAFAGRYKPVCINDAPFLLTGTPAGGFFFSADFPASYKSNYFNPANYLPGDHMIYYSYVFPDSSRLLVDSTIITVLPRYFPRYSNTERQICINSGTLQLGAQTTAAFAKYSWSGSGISDSTFDPVKAGPGRHIIHFSYTDTNGCSFTDNFLEYVDTVPHFFIKPNQASGYAPYTVYFSTSMINLS